MESLIESNAYILIPWMGPSVSNSGQEVDTCSSPLGCISTFSDPDMCSVWIGFQTWQRNLVIQWIRHSVGIHYWIAHRFFMVLANHWNRRVITKMLKWCRYYKKDFNFKLNMIYKNFACLTCLSYWC